MPTTNPVLKDKSIQDVMKVIRASRSYQEAADRIGVSRKTLTGWLARKGVKAETDIQLKGHPFSHPSTQSSLDVTREEGRAMVNAQNLIRELRGERDTLAAEVLDQHNMFDRVAAELVESRPDPGFSFTYNKSRDKIRDAIMPIYDCQFGQRTLPEDTPFGLGEFNSEVFERRVRTYVNAVGQEIGDYAMSHVIEKVVIVMGGDMVEGDEIFGDQSWQLEFDPIEQMVRLSHIWGWGLHELVGFLKEEIGVGYIALLCLPGNHGKVGGRKRAGRPSSYSWDYGFYRMLEKELKNYPIDLFAIEKAGSLFFESQGATFLAIHGDGIRSWGSIPYYGFTRHDAKALRLTNTFYDYIISGHIHQMANIPVGYGEWFVSGSWVGANQHTKEVYQANLPSQHLFFNSRKYGVQGRTPIMLETRANLPKPHVHMREEIG